MSGMMSRLMNFIQLPEKFMVSQISKTKNKHYKLHTSIHEL